MKKKKVEKVKNKKLIIFILTALVITSIILLIFINNKKINITNIKIENTKFHEIKVNWNYTNNKDNFAIILSEHKFNKNIINKLNNNTLDNNYIVIDTKTNKEQLVNVLSNTTYYIGIVTYKVKDNKKVYLNISDIKNIETSKLTLNDINDIKTTDITDNSIKLEWDNVLINEKNLDGTDILVTYTILEKIDNTSSEINNYKEINTITDNYIVINDLSSFKEYTYKIHVNALVDNKLISSLDKDITVITKLPKVNNIKTSVDYNSIKLTWDKLNIDLLENDILTYDIYSSSSKDGEYKLLKEGINSDNYTDTNLKENQTKYYYILARVKRNDLIFDSINSDIISATTKKKTTTSTNKNNKTNNSNTNNNSNNGNSSNTGELTSQEKDRLAREVAKKIAASITGSNDLEKVTKAAQAVSEYYQRGVHIETGVDYRTPYGVFIKGEASCSGTTRALGMVLEYMGYSWTHAHENEWTHQWVILTMDGQIGYADGQVGFAGYGEHPAANW